MSVRVQDASSRRIAQTAARNSSRVRPGRMTWCQRRGGAAFASSATTERMLVEVPRTEKLVEPDSAIYPDRKKGSRYMLRVLVAACALLVPALTGPYAVASAATVSVDGLTLGQLEVVMPDGEPQGLVFLFSDEPGPTAEFASAAAKLAGLDLMVAPVALSPFLDRQDAQGQGDKCL